MNNKIFQAARFLVSVMFLLQLRHPIHATLVMQFLLILLFEHAKARVGFQAQLVNYDGYLDAHDYVDANGYVDAFSEEAKVTNDSKKTKDPDDYQYVAEPSEDHKAGVINPEVDNI